MVAYLPYKTKGWELYRKFVNQRFCNYQKFNQILENSAKKCKYMFHIKHLYIVARLTNNVKGIDLLKFGVFLCMAKFRKYHVYQKMHTYCIPWLLRKKWIIRYTFQNNFFSGTIYNCKTTIFNHWIWFVVLHLNIISM